MARTCHAAVDLGAGSGRVLVGTIDDDGVRLEEAHRFAYAPRRTAGHLRWDMTSLLSGLREGLQCAHVTASTWNARLESVGVDAWGVDYLNQATANVTARPVLAGPVEATSLGNALMQSVACGKTTVQGGRMLIRVAHPPRLFEPAGTAPWQDAKDRYRRVETDALRRLTSART